MNPLQTYLCKMKGGVCTATCVPMSEVLWSWFGAFAGISIVCYLHYGYLAGSDMVLVVGSFGASAVLIYGSVKSPLAQPRNLVGGHLISALVGVTAYKLFPSTLWLAAALAVATAIALMHLTRTLHPPGGATALIAVIGSKDIHSLGYQYVLMPVGLGAIILLVIAILVNNIPSTRKYPEFWF